MTRKDYIAIAGALLLAEQDAWKWAKFRPEHSNLYRDGIYAAAVCMADAMAADNPRFDREHFLAVVRGERELTSRPPRKRYCEADLEFATAATAGFRRRIG